MSTSLPAPRPRRTFPEISAVSWEHPADRAALQALRAIPGVDEVIRKMLALLGGERGIRLLFQGNAVRVGPTQFPKLWHLHTEVVHHLRLARRSRSCTSRRRRSSTPAPTASTSRSSCSIRRRIELLDDDELRVLLSHELGHVMSGHALYRTIAAILALISLGALPMLASLAVLPVRLAFLEWSRKSELSADRAGLLGAQDIVAAQRLDMKMAGGGRGDGVRRPAQRRRVHAAGARVRRERRRARRRLQDAQHARAHPSDAHRARRRAAALGDERRVRPHPARRVRPPRARDRRSGRSGTT